MTGPDDDLPVLQSPLCDDRDWDDDSDAGHTACPPPDDEVPF